MSPPCRPSVRSLAGVSPGGRRVCVCGGGRGAGMCAGHKEMGALSPQPLPRSLGVTGTRTVRLAGLCFGLFGL